MRRNFVFVGLTTLCLAAGVLIGQATIVKAGSSPGLSGRTHLIVKEPNLKSLSFVAPAQGSTYTVSLRERGRDGTLGGTAYTVPVGRVFIVTDIRVDIAAGAYTSGGNLSAKLTGPGGDRWLVRATDPNVTDVAEDHLSGGIAYQPGSTVDITLEGGSGFLVRFDVLGYDTVDVP
ncbi:MAG: hypothetical protein HYR85_17745 [Planctomycetes bacterium]|nr:hypothetical protein [Planctomycetota bacterium]MBI3845193.1 hypothetical protein [Planctomycetota bacterium]